MGVRRESSATGRFHGIDVLVLGGLVFRAALGRLNLLDGKELSGGKKGCKNKTRDPLAESRDSIETE